VPQPEALQPMAIIRTGGFAGVHETLEIDGDGRWTYSDGRGASRAGQLDEAARTRLATIQADPGLAAEIARIPDIGCCDQFDYELRISERTYTFEDLGDIGPLLRELLELLRAQTGY
jgi:hypothetical protein